MKPVRNLTLVVTLALSLALPALAAPPRERDRDLPLLERIVKAVKKAVKTLDDVPIPPRP